MKSGIYTILNKINGKTYVGCTVNLRRRSLVHFSNLRKNKHKNSHLQNAWNEYGEENFEFEILEECEEKFLIALEHYWATTLNTHSREKGYNIASTHPDKISSNTSKEFFKGMDNKRTIIKYDDIENINNLINKGHTYKEIEKILGYVEGYISAKINMKVGSKKLKDLILPNLNGRNLSRANQEFINEINRDIKEGLIDKEIEKKYNLYDKYLIEIRRMKKFKSFDILPANRCKKLKQEDLKKISNQIKEGIPMKEIAKNFKVSKSTIYFYKSNIINALSGTSTEKIVGSIL